MGMFVNPDNSAFQVALNSEIYVDKTGLIKYTNRVLNTFAIVVRDVLENPLLQICLRLITVEAVIPKLCLQAWKLVRMLILRST